ncbi:MAG: hypothetical protein FJ403_08225 [Verrucomicrobia bacterium]|nr:hypothetical protein [Verrucomicrobiota bacterium]
MSLKAFHIVFIAASTLLVLGFGAWCLRNYFGKNGAGVDLALGAGSFLLAAGLVIYGKYFLKKLKRISYL